MREIYQYAEQVLVCLSTEKVDPKGMDWLLGLARAARTQDFDMALKAQQGPVGVDRDHQDRLMEHIRANMNDEEFTEGWVAFQEIVEAPWFTRAWVF
jgi:hypothetical protein